MPYLSDADLTEDWAEHWFQFADLFIDISSPVDPTPMPDPPSDHEELRFQTLRSWFLEHQEQFVPLWDEYHRRRSDATPDDEDIEDRYNKNPFLLFYEPENLYQMAESLGLQEGTERWNPTEEIAGMLRAVVCDFSKVVKDFAHYVDV